MGRPRPAPSFVQIIVLIVHTKALVFQLVDHGVIAFVLDVRIDDHNELPVMSIKLLLHTNWIWERMLVPGEVLLAVSVFDVKPYHVIWDIVLVKLPIDIFDVFISHIVPSALMISNGKLLRKLRVSSKLGVLLDNSFRVWTEENEDVDKSTLGEPVCFSV